MNHSLLDISIAIHYWTHPGDYAANDQQHANSIAVRDSLKRLVEAGLLTANDDFHVNPAKYVSTEALGVYCDGLRDVPWPIQIWVIPKKES